MRVKRILCRIVKETQLCDPNQQQAQVQRLRPTSDTHVKRLRLEGKQHVQNRESSVTTHVPRQPMDLSDTSARVPLNATRGLVESQDDLLEDPGEDKVMIDEILVNEEVEHPRSDVVSHSERI